MTAIYTRQTGTTGTNGVTRLDAPLSNTQIDTNFINLNDNKLELAGGTTVTTLGTIGTGTWNATTIATTKGGTGLTSFTSGGAVYATSTSALTTGTLPVASGGTGQTSFTNGQILIGNTTGNTLVKTTLTGTANQITVTNGAGSITLSTPQAIATSSSVQFGSLGIGTTASGVTGQIRATDDIIAWDTSDKKYKENVTDIQNALEIVTSIGGKLFQWTDAYIEMNGGADGYFIRKDDFGVIAQDVQAAFPLGVRVKEDGTLAVDYAKLCALAFAAIKDLNNQIEELKGIK